MWVLDPVANEVLYNLTYPIAQNSRMQYKKYIIKGTIGMLFVFTGSTQKRWPSEKVGSWFPAGKGRYQSKSGWGGAPWQCGQETESQYPGHTERKESDGDRNHHTEN